MESENTPSKFDPYRLYIQRTVKNDKMFVNECNESMDTMMVFVSTWFHLVSEH